MRPFSVGGSDSIIGRSPFARRSETPSSRLPRGRTQLDHDAAAPLVPSKVVEADGNNGDGRGAALLGRRGVSERDERDPWLELEQVGLVVGAALGEEADGA